MGTESAIYIVAEIGNDLSSFRTANHLAAWAGLAPKDNQSADKVRPSKTKKANQYVKSLLVQCAWAATRTRGTRLSLWYWQNTKRLGDKKAIIGMARKILCYIYAMLKSGTTYDKSLDVAYAENMRAKKLDAAQKIVGSRKSDAPSSKQHDNDEEAPLAHSQDGFHNGIGLTDKQVGSGNQHDKSGIESPNETVTPKKRGRPKKVVSV